MFDRCPLDGANQRKWLKPNTKASEKLSDILLNKKLLSDVKKLSPLQQTSSVEAFHSLIIQFSLLIKRLMHYKNCYRCQIGISVISTVFSLSFICDYSILRVKLLIRLQTALLGAR